MGRCGIVFAALLLVLGLARPAKADQLACNSRAVAERAAAVLKQGAVVLDYCSNCTDQVKVIQVSSARAVQGCQWELEVSGQQLYTSEGAPPKSGDARGTAFSRTKRRYTKRVDLAYFYVETRHDEFRWLGGELGLSASVETSKITLGKRFRSKLPGHVPLQIERPDEPEAPKLAALGFSHFARGNPRKIVDAWDEGEREDAAELAESRLRRALDSALGRKSRGDMPSGKQAFSLAVQGFQERMGRRGWAPLRGVFQGMALRFIEALPTAKLESAIVALALFAGTRGYTSGDRKAMQRAAKALLLDGTTQSDLARRGPLAAQLTRFYAALYLLAVDPDAGADADVRIVTARLAEYFEQEKRLYKGNYGATLRKALGVDGSGAAVEKPPAPLSPGQTHWEVQVHPGSGLEVREAKKVLARSRGAVRHCLERAKSTVELRVSFSVDGRGRTQGVELSGQVHRGEVDQCLKGRLRRVRWPRSDSGEPSRVFLVLTHRPGGKKRMPHKTIDMGIELPGGARRK